MIQIRTRTGWFSPRAQLSTELLEVVEAEWEERIGDDAPVGMHVAVDDDRRENAGDRA